MQDGQPAHARVEHADGARVHRAIVGCRRWRAIRLGTCSWADEGLVKQLVPARRLLAGGATRLLRRALRHVEVDSPFYRLPSPETAAKWAERTPDGFVWHAKASGEMTGHEEAGPRDGLPRVPRGARAARGAPGSSAASCSSTTRASKKSREAKQELAAVGPLLDPLVPLIEFRHRSWMEEDERADTLAFLERHGLAYVSVDSPRTRASNVMPRIAAATHPVAYVRFHGRNWQTWNIRDARSSADRFDWMYSAEELAEWVGAAGRARRPRRRGLRADEQQHERLRPAERPDPPRPPRRAGDPGHGRRSSRRRPAS